MNRICRWIMASMAMGGVAWLWLGLGYAVADAAEAEPSSGLELRVLTYNIHHAEGTDGVIDYARLARMIQAFEPDVVALQEVDRMTGRVERVDQIQRLAELTGMHFTFGKAMDYDGGEYGNAILSRFPLSEVRVHALPKGDGAGQEPRAAVDALVVPPANRMPPFRFVSTHLCHLRDETRLEQSEVLIRALRENADPEPVVLAGDFNARAGSASIIAWISAGWRDATAPQSVIDYIWVRAADAWGVREVHTLNDRIVSDHRPVLAVLQAPPAQAAEAAAP